MACREFEGWMSWWKDFGTIERLFRVSEALLISACWAVGNYTNRACLEAESAPVKAFVRYVIIASLSTFGFAWFWNAVYRYIQLRFIHIPPTAMIHYQYASASISNDSPQSVYWATGLFPNLSWNRRRRRSIFSFQSFKKEKNQFRSAGGSHMSLQRLRETGLLSLLSMPLSFFVCFFFFLCLFLSFFLCFFLSLSNSFFPAFTFYPAITRYDICRKRQLKTF